MFLIRLFQNKTALSNKAWENFLAVHNEIKKIEQTIFPSKDNETPENKKQAFNELKNNPEYQRKCIQAAELLSEIRKSGDIDQSKKLVNSAKPDLHDAGTTQDVDYWFHEYTKRIQVFDWLNHLSSTAIQQLLEKQSNHLEVKGGFGLASMSLLIALEKQKRPDFHCYTVDILELDNSLDKLFKGYKELPEGVSHRAQVIINNNSHYTTVDFHISREGVKFILLDAANEPRAAVVLDKFMQNEAIVDGVAVGADRAIQKDAKSCPVFALDQAIQISKIDIFEDLKKLESENFQVTWLDMPPELVRLAQSPSWIEEYKKRYLSEHPSVSAEELDRNFPPSLNIPFNHPKTGAEVNCLNSPEILFKEYSAAVLHFIKTHTPEDLTQIYKKENTPSAPHRDSTAQAMSGLTIKKLDYETLMTLRSLKEPDPGEISPHTAVNLPGTPEHTESEDKTQKSQITTSSQYR